MTSGKQFHEMNKRNDSPSPVARENQTNGLADPMEGSLTWKALYQEGRRLLEPVALSGCNPDFEAKCLLEHVTGCTPAQLPLKGGQAASREQVQQYMDAVAQRLGGRPLQYILGNWEFYGLTFEVGDGVLIPRPETELLVDAALGLGSASHKLRVLDLCSGSGCVAVAIAKNRPGWQVEAVELSPQAFSYLEQNIRQNGVQIQARMGDAFLPPQDYRYDVITANPPYIPLGEEQELQKEVLQEPHMALFAGQDGLDFYRRLPELYQPLLNHGGWLLLEIGWNQGEAVQGFLLQAGYTDVETLKDLSGCDRVVRGRRG